MLYFLCEFFNVRVYIPFCWLLRLSLCYSAALIIRLKLSQSLICLQSSLYLFYLFFYCLDCSEIKTDNTILSRMILSNHKQSHNLFLFSTFGMFSIPKSFRPQSDQQWSSFSLTFFSKKKKKNPQKTQMICTVCADHHKVKRYPLHINQIV